MERVRSPCPFGAVLVEACRHLNDPIYLHKLVVLVQLSIVQQRAVQSYPGRWCDLGLALRDILREAVEVVAPTLHPKAMALLLAWAAGKPGSAAAKELGIGQAALRKFATPRIEEALEMYIEHLERRSAA